MVNNDLVGCDLKENEKLHLYCIFNLFLKIFFRNCLIILSDMLTRIRNANLVKAKKVNVIRTSLTVQIAEILEDEGFISSFEEVGPVFLTETGSVRKYLSIKLKYKGSTLIGFITGLKRISKPGLRVYSGHKHIPKVLGGIGIAVFRSFNKFLKN